MLRFLLNALLALLAVRFLLGLVRHARMAGRTEEPRVPREASRGSRLPVDRSAAIDVPYTEVEAGEGGSTTAGETRGPKARA